MELLDAMLEKNVRLIDYEKMCDETGNLLMIHCSSIIRYKEDVDKAHIEKLIVSTFNT